MTIKPTLNQTLYAIAWTLAQATKEALDGEVEACHKRLEEIERDIAAYRKSLPSNFKPAGAEYQSEGSRPDGWMTVLEYIYTHDPHFFDYCEDIAVETSGFGVKASRLMKLSNAKPWKVAAPECLGEDRHIIEVNAYPSNILAQAVR